jgi:lipid-A-disaccharide synthase
LRRANIALVTSGTATLETALLDVPQVVCYRGNALSVFLAKRLVKVKYASPVNLILDKLVIKELIQEDLNPLNLASEAERLLQPDTQEAIKKEYKQLREVLGDIKSGERTAELIYTSSYEN